MMYLTTDTKTVGCSATATAAVVVTTPASNGRSKSLYKDFMAALAPIMKPKQNDVPVVDRTTEARETGEGEEEEGPRHFSGTGKGESQRKKKTERGRKRKRVRSISVEQGKEKGEDAQLGLYME